MIFSTFPFFRRISPLDRQSYLTYYQQSEPYSDFSFNNLLIWLDYNNDLEVSQHKDSIVFKFSNVFENNRLAYTMFGNTNCLQTVEAVFDSQEKLGLEAELTMVPECVLNNILTQQVALPQSLCITVDTANRDYVFDINKALAMEGSSYSDFRRKIRIVEKQNQNLKVIIKDLKNPETHHLIKAALQQWSQDEKFMRNDPRHVEIDVINRYLSLMNHLSAVCLTVLIDKQLASFSIFHFPPQKDWVIVNHIKCDHSIKFLFDYTYFLLLKECVKAGIKYMNFEQDLNINGMRYHKESLRPVDFLYRYNLTRL